MYSRLNSSKGAWIANSGKNNFEPLANFLYMANLQENIIFLWTESICFLNRLELFDEMHTIYFEDFPTERGWLISIDLEKRS